MNHNRNKLAVGAILLLAISLIVAVKSLHSQLVCSVPQGVHSLLQGCTVSATNTVQACTYNYPPASWTQVDAQGFETGALHGFEQFSGDSSIGTGHPHTGTHDMEGTVNYTSTNIVMYETTGVLGTWNEIYISFWEFLPTTARFNDEWDPVFLNSRDAVDPFGTYRQILPVNFEDDITFAYNSPTTSVKLELQGSAGALDTTISYIPSKTYPVGVWTQWEIHIKPNTPGQVNGVYELWQNGVNIVEDSGENINGIWDFTGSQGSGHTVDFQVGGLYSKLNYTSNGSLMKPAGTCDPAAGCVCGNPLGNGLAVAWNGLYNDPAALTTLGNCSPIPPTFKAYFDDIIIIKK